jgi:hypothetical protein
MNSSATASASISSITVSNPIIQTNNTNNTNNTNSGTVIPTIIPSLKPTTSYVNDNIHNYDATTLIIFVSCVSVIIIFSVFYMIYLFYKRRYSRYLRYLRRENEIPQYQTRLLNSDDINLTIVS